MVSIIRYHRFSDFSDLEELTDSFLLSQFPGRTLEELDNVDFPRLMRVLAVKSVGETEVLKLSYMKGLIKPNQINQPQWERIARHDQLLGEI